MERTVQANGVDLCTESFGNPADPPILLVMGVSASMLWWDESFCRMLAGGGRFVIRYDNRDTGRSVTYEPGRPRYSGADLLDDALGVLDAYGIAAAHIAAIDFRVGYTRVLAGGIREFDEAAARALMQREVDRARDFSAMQNHDLIAGDERRLGPLSSITARTLVIHGTADPMFPIEHGRALAEEIPGARLLPLEGAGHGVAPADRRLIVDAILDHTTDIGDTRNAPARSEATRELGHE